jgi:UDP-2-acetamido-2-deoxy-ribo-hexuluronate aminotransferase
MPLQMVDLKSQYLNLKTELNKAVLDCIASTAYINGPEVKRFQQNLEQFLGVKHVIPCANGTDALQIAMMALDLEQGDEVIVPAFTYVATAEVIALLKLTPVMVDVDSKTFNITAETIEKVITPRTKAIVPVHLFGQSADMEAIMAVAKKYNLFVIEDNAQAIGADYIFGHGKVQKTGTIGDFGCTSFFPSKNLGCYGDGGALMTNNDELAARARRIANHGQSQQYFHEETGVNSRLDSLQAAILNVKLPHLNQYNQARQAAADFYDNAFEAIDDLQTPIRAQNSTHVFHQYTLQVRGGNKQRAALQQHLKNQGIPAMIYYPVPLYRQKAFANYWNGHTLRVTEKLCESVISLPIHTEMNPDILKYIVSNVLSFFR